MDRTRRVGEERASKRIKEKGQGGAGEERRSRLGREGLDGGEYEGEGDDKQKKEKEEERSMNDWAG